MFSSLATNILFTLPLKKVPPELKLESIVPSEFSLINLLELVPLYPVKEP